MPQSPGLQAPASSPGSFIPQLSLNTSSGKPSLNSQTDSKAPPRSHPAPQASPIPAPHSGFAASVVCLTTGPRGGNVLIPYPLCFWRLQKHLPNE